MPFTPSHAVVALPFIRTPLVPAAIAVGAMAPDLPLFVRIAPLSYLVTHDLAWMPVTTAIAFGLLLVWRCILRPGVRELSPGWLARRLPQGWDASSRAALRETAGSLRGILLVILSLLIGVASHITWDLFTHAGRAGIPALDAMWGPLPGFTWLQHGSSLLGIAVLVVCAAMWAERATPRAPVDRVLPDPLRWAWWASLPAVLVVAAVAGYAVLGPLRPDFGPAHLAYAVLPPACAMWGVLTAALCVVVQLLRRSAIRAGSRSGPA